MGILRNSCWNLVEFLLESNVIPVESCGNPEEFLLESCWSSCWNLVEFMWNQVGILRNSCGNAVEFMWKSFTIHQETCGICMEMLWKSWGNPGGNLTETESLPWAHEVLFSNEFLHHYPTRSKFRKKGLSPISLLNTSADLCSSA